MKQPERKSRRRGLSMLELIIASSMLAMVLTTVAVVLRTGRQAWEAFEADHAAVEAAHATVRHIVRGARQADRVSAISDPTSSSGSLSLVLADGTIAVWDHDSGTNSVLYGLGNAGSLLAPQIAELRFSGYRADGVTATTDPDRIAAVLVEAAVQLPVEVNATRRVRSWVWLRSW